MRKLRLGIGAHAMVFMRYLHPKKFISETYVNATHNKKVEGLMVNGRDRIKVSGRVQNVVYFLHKDFDDTCLNCTPQWVMITKEVPEDHLFIVDDGGHDRDTGNGNALTCVGTSDAGE